MIGGMIDAEYDALTKKVTHLYTLREMGLPEGKHNQDLQQTIGNETGSNKPAT